MKGIRCTSLIPVGFVIEDVDTSGAMIVMVVRAMNRTSVCPACGASASRIHSRYHRRLMDLPVGGRVMQLIVLARRFHCDAGLPPRGDPVSMLVHGGL